MENLFSTFGFSIFRSKMLISILLFVVLNALFFPSTLRAAPFSKHFQFTQPDNDKLTMWGEGDDFHAVFETLDGYTVVFDPQKKAYFYAERSGDGKSLTSTGTYAHKMPPQSLARHIRINTDTDITATKARRKQWYSDTGLSRRWSSLKSQALGTPAVVEKSGAQLSPPRNFTTGSRVGITLLIDFPDAPATISESEIDSFLNGRTYSGFGNNGSVRQYFQDVSNNRLDYTNLVTMYVRMTQPKSYYDNTSYGCGVQGRLLVSDALAILKSRGDYTSTILPALNALTDDGAGRVIAFNVLFAGSDSGVWNYGLWPHSWVLPSPLPLDNRKFLYNYQITNVGDSLELGTFCHENGHMLCAFPDLYDYGYDSVGGAGVFSLMGYGGSGTNPKQVDAYLKTAAGWATVTDLDTSSNLTGRLVAAPNIGNDNFYRYRRPGVLTEYFLFENRQKLGRDAGLPAAGIAVWHVDELGNRDNQSLTPNSSHQNYELTLVQADDSWHFEKYLNYGDPFDLFYQGNVSATYNNNLNDVTAPNSHWWDGSHSEMKLSNFSIPGVNMTFDVGTVSPPVGAVEVSGPAGKDVPAGSSVSYAFTVRNVGAIEDTYNLIAVSSRGWANTSGVPTQVVVTPGENITYSITVNVPVTANAGDFDTLSFSAISTNDPSIRGNAELTTKVPVDSVPPTISIEVPFANISVQDIITISASATDMSGVANVRFYVRERNGATGIPVGKEDLIATLNASTGRWEYKLDSTQLSDGYYVVLAKAVDRHGNEGFSAALPFSIRNWAIAKLLPASEGNKAGRTMPVKFSLRVASNVDPLTPFVVNHDLEVKVFKSSDPSNVLQKSVFGAGSADYRISALAKQYQTNFKTSDTPTRYTVEIWRKNKEWLIGSFSFKTLK